MIYDKSVVELMRQYVAEHPQQDRFTTEAVLAWFSAHWPKIKEGTIRAHLIKMSTNAPSRVHLGAKPGVHDLLYQLGPGEYRLYEPARDPAPIYPGKVAGEGAETDTSVILEPVTDGMEAGGEQFAYESHLRDYLAHHLHVIEPGLQVYDDEGIPGVEYPIRNRRIDILARAQDGSLVVIELKVSRGHDKALGQLLTYMGWVRQDLADGQPVRGVLVAHRLSDELITAAQESHADIRMFEYELSFTIHPKR